MGLPAPLPSGNVEGTGYLAAAQILTPSGTAWRPCYPLVSMCRGEGSGLCDGLGQARVKRRCCLQFLNQPGSLRSALFIKHCTNISFVIRRILILHTGQGCLDYYTLLKINLKMLWLPMWAGEACTPI